LGQVRKELRHYTGGADGEIKHHSSSLSPQHLEKSSKDEREFEQVRFRMTEQYTHLQLLDDRYLRSRHIIISHDSRFGNVRTDARGNTCFPHYKDGGIVGWEKKNLDFTGYADGGKKVGIYATTNFRDAKRVVIVESGIDAMSHAQLFNTGDETAYVSTGGSLTKEQLKTLAEIVKDKEVIIATDNDEAGLKYADKLSQELDHVARQIPESKDWNDVLKTKQIRQEELKREISGEALGVLDDAFIRKTRDHEQGPGFF